ncbi:MAG: hypothetical protein FWD97_10720 [Defluviitaleaceae bacterium]|nr:hypothetical protein [Defluviitaleaceae bacterium]
MFKAQYKKEMEQITPSQDLLNRTKAAMKSELTSKKKKHKPFPKRPILPGVIAFATVAAVLLVAVFGRNLFNQSGDIFPANAFAMRVYAMELQPDGSYVRREMDITLLEGWHGYYDGEALYISIGLWFEFEGENISTVEFLLENGFFAAQYIGNWGQVEGVSRGHVTIPPDFTTSRLVMYGTEFEKIGNAFTFAGAMPEDMLLFWGSHDMNYRDWSGPNMVIKINMTVTFEDGEVHNQPLVLDFYASGGGGMMSIAEGAITPIDTGLDLFTDAQMDYVLSAPMESFTHVPSAVRELNSEAFLDTVIKSFEFYIGNHMPMGLRPHPFVGEETGSQRFPMGVRDGIGYVVIVEFVDAVVLTASAYAIPLN